MGFLPVVSKVASEVFVAEAVFVILVTLVFAVDDGMLVAAEFTGMLLHLSIKGTAIFVPFLLLYKILCVERDKIIKNASCSQFLQWVISFIWLFK